jgi:hypothetical protein
MPGVIDREAHTVTDARHVRELSRDVHRLGRPPTPADAARSGFGSRAPG